MSDYECPSSSGVAAQALGVRRRRDQMSGEDSSTSVPDSCESSCESSTQEDRSPVKKKVFVRDDEQVNEQDKDNKVASRGEQDDRCTGAVVSEEAGPRPSTSGSETGFEYLDHPADVQLHSWGSTMAQAIEQLVLSMYNYMTDLKRVEEIYPYYFEATGRDEDTLLFSILQEPLEAFQSEPFFIGKRVELIDLDLVNFKASFRAFGDSFDLSKHSQEADVKAITHSAMQVKKTEERTDIFVIVDI